MLARILTPLAGVAMALAVAAPAGAANKTVLIGSSFYDPQTVTIDAGDSVTWTNGQGRHTVSSDVGAFDSGPLAEGQTFSFTFATAGTFRYSDRLNPATRPGTVIVQARDNAPPVARVSASALTAPAGTAITFDASGSADDGSLARFQWDFDGDGAFETDTGPTPRIARAFARPGTVRVGLLVTDDRGSSAVAAPVAVTVTAAARSQDTTGPDLSYLGLRPASVRRGRAVRVALNVGERARLEIRVQRFRANRSPLTVARLTRDVRSGDVSLRLATKALRVGRHRLTIVALDAAGNRSRTVQPRFRVRA